MLLHASSNQRKQTVRLHAAPCPPGVIKYWPFLLRHPLGMKGSISQSFCSSGGVVYWVIDSTNPDPASLLLSFSYCHKVIHKRRYILIGLTESADVLMDGQSNRKADLGAGTDAKERDGVATWWGASTPEASEMWPMTAARAWVEATVAVHGCCRRSTRSAPSPGR